MLVGEAILSKNVPDITASVATAVYNSGVKRPQPAMAPAASTVPAAMPVAPTAVTEVPAR